MRTFDPTPLWRSTVRFDRLFGLLDESPAVDWRRHLSALVTLNGPMRTTT